MLLVPAPKGPRLESWRRVLVIIAHTCPGGWCRGPLCMLSTTVTISVMEAEEELPWLSIPAQDVVLLNCLLLLMTVTAADIIAWTAPSHSSSPKVSSYEFFSCFFGLLVTAGRCRRQMQSGRRGGQKRPPPRPAAHCCLTLLHLGLTRLPLSASLVRPASLSLGLASGSSYRPVALVHASMSLLDVSGRSRLTIKVFWPPSLRFSAAFSASKP